MVELTGCNLPKRQRELNDRVKEAVSQKIDFNEIKCLEETSDVDKLFKIDVASKYKNLDYMIEVLKSGDPLCISRALKCTWMYDEEHSSIINPDYLQRKVFPKMSLKIIVKTLTTISKYVRDEVRALTFYEYCRKIKFYKITKKFVLYISEEHKLDYLKTTEHLDEKDLAHFIGNSFLLAETYLSGYKADYCINILLGKLSYLYSVCNETYLNLLELYCNCRNSNTKELGVKMSKNILTKHKLRVIKEPKLYVRLLNINMLVRQSTAEDAKLFLNVLAPDKVVQFWNTLSNESSKMLPILKILQENERLIYLKQLFTTKYPGEPFEGSESFYRHKLYQLMSFEETEVWALKYLKGNIEWLSKHEEFVWCKFVNFQLAFQAIKKYILVTTDSAIRGEMLNILVDNAGTEENLEGLLKYIYARHINERKNIIKSIINKICETYNVFAFQQPCWQVFNKILHRMNVYTREGRFCYNELRTLCIIRHIIDEKDVPEQLQAEDINSSNADYFKACMNKLSDDQRPLLYQYYLNLCTCKVESCENKEYNENIKMELRSYLYSAILILELFNKSKDDCPEVIMKYIKLDWSYFEELDFLRIRKKYSEGYLLRLLKQDYKLFLNELPEVKAACTRYFLDHINLRLSRVMRKIKIYFANDVAKEILKTLEEWFLEMDKYIYYKLYHVTICSMLQIADEDYKLKFISKYVPSTSKIEHDEIDHNVLQIQLNICRFALYSRPPLPLEEIFKFIKGDYVQYCLPMFHHFCMNLPRPLAYKFISSTLDSPVSVQKHGIRLAIQFFSIKEMEEIITKRWGQTNNVFLRKVIYTKLFKRVEDSDSADRKFHVLLNEITAELREDDDDDIFDLFCGVSLSESFHSDYLETVWKVVNKFPKNRLKNLERQSGVVETIRLNIQIMNKDFCRKEILDEFIKSMLIDRDIQNESQNQETDKLISEKWNLVIAYILHYDDKEERSKSLELVATVIGKCVGMFDYAHKEVYTIRKFLMEFLDKLLTLSYKESSKGHAIPILQSIIKQLEVCLPISQIYLMYCKLNFGVISERILKSKINELEQRNIDFENLQKEDIAGEFAKELVKFLKDLKRKRMLYTSVYNEMAVHINNALETMTLDTNIDAHDLVIDVCDHLTDVKSFETFAIAMFLLPFDTDRRNILHIANKINEFNHEEIDTLFWTKTISNDYKMLLTTNSNRNNQARKFRLSRVYLIFIVLCVYNVIFVFFVGRFLL